MKINLQFLKHFNFGLDKRGALSIVAELVNEFLDMGTELGLGFILPLLVLSSLLPCLVEVLIVTSAMKTVINTTDTGKFHSCVTNAVDLRGSPKMFLKIQLTGTYQLFVSEDVEHL